MNNLPTENFILVLLTSSISAYAQYHHWIFYLDFINVTNIIKLVAVNPATSASGERIFSEAGNLKTWLRSTIKFFNVFSFFWDIQGSDFLFFCFFCFLFFYRKVLMYYCMVAAKGYVYLKKPLQLQVCLKTKDRLLRPDNYDYATLLKCLKIFFKYI